MRFSWTDYNEKKYVSIWCEEVGRGVAGKTSEMPSAVVRAPNEPGFESVNSEGCGEFKIPLLVANARGATSTCPRNPPPWLLGDSNSSAPTETTQQPTQQSTSTALRYQLLSELWSLGRRTSSPRRELLLLNERSRPRDRAAFSRLDRK